jgi:hypothetical protein
MCFGAAACLRGPNAYPGAPRRDATDSRSPAGPDSPRRLAPFLGPHRPDLWHSAYPSANILFSTLTRRVQADPPARPALPRTTTSHGNPPTGCRGLSEVSTVITAPPERQRRPRARSRRHAGPWSSLPALTCHTDQGPLRRPGPQPRPGVPRQTETARGQIISQRLHSVLIAPRMSPGPRSRGRSMTWPCRERTGGRRGMGQRDAGHQSHMK